MPILNIPDTREVQFETPLIRSRIARLLEIMDNSQRAPSDLDAMSELASNERNATADH